MAKQIEPLSQELIQRRAHEIYMESGCVEGRDLDNWLEAERQLTLGQAKASRMAEPEAPTELLSAQGRARPQVQQPRLHRRRR